MKFCFNSSIPRYLVKSADILNEPGLSFLPIHAKNFPKTSENNLLVSYFFRRKKEYFQGLKAKSSNEIMKEFCTDIVSRIQSASEKKIDESVKALAFQNWSENTPSELLGCALHLSKEDKTAFLYYKLLVQTDVSNWSATTIGDVLDYLNKKEVLSAEDQGLIQKITEQLQPLSAGEQLSLASNSVDRFKKAENDFFTKTLQQKNFGKIQKFICSALLTLRGFNSWNLGMQRFSSKEELERAESLLQPLLARRSTSPHPG